MAVEPGEHLTRQPAPRVLVNLASADTNRAIADLLAEFVPTVRAIAWPGEVNLSEWDVLITRRGPLDMTSEDKNEGHYGSHDPEVIHRWKQEYPPHLCLLLIVPAKRSDLEVVDAYPSDGESDDVPPVAIVQDPTTIGSHVRAVKGLPENLSALIADTLAPAAKKRTEHASIRRFAVEDVPDDAEDALLLRPFLLGPNDCILAGSYERSDQASVWIIPDDCPNLPAWVRAALGEWNEMYPSRFPKIPNWDADAAWQSAAELEVTARMDTLRAEILAKSQEYEAANKALEADLEAAREHAAMYERALLTADGDVLVDAVACALADLGLHVTNMDEHWLDNDRREDLRVFIDGDPDWVAIVEVKGFTKGVKETELQAFGRWAERFILDHHRLPDRRWFVANHDRRRDPSDRPVPFAHKPAIIDVFKSQSGLVIDTIALFEALREVRADPSRVDEVRGWLVEALGLATSIPSK